MSTPYVFGSATSADAAKSIEETSGTLRAKVYYYALSVGSFGATRDEIEIALFMTHQTASARVRELVRMGCLCEHPGLIRQTRSGRNAVVFTAVPGKNPLLSPPAYDPIESAIARLAEFIGRGMTDRDSVVERLDDLLRNVDA